MNYAHLVLLVIPVWDTSSCLNLWHWLFNFNRPITTKCLSWVRAMARQCSKAPHCKKPLCFLNNVLYFSSSVDLCPIVCAIHLSMQIYFNKWQPILNQYCIKISFISHPSPLKHRKSDIGAEMQIALCANRLHRVPPLQSSTKTVCEVKCHVCLWRLAKTANPNFIKLCGKRKILMCVLF